MEPFTLIAIILGATVGLGLVVVTIIYWDDIINWFQSRNSLKAADRDNLAFTLKQKLATGDYKVVQGIFNTRTEQLLDGRVMQAKSLDYQFDREHRNKELVFYE